MKKRKINRDFQNIVHLGVKINIALDNLKDAVKMLNDKIDETIIHQMKQKRKGD